MVKHLASNFPIKMPGHLPLPVLLCRGCFFCVCSFRPFFCSFSLLLKSNETKQKISLRWKLFWRWQKLLYNIFTRSAGSVLVCGKIFKKALKPQNFQEKGTFFAIGLAQRVPDDSLPGFLHASREKNVPWEIKKAQRIVTYEVYVRIKAEKYLINGKTFFYTHRPHQPTSHLLLFHNLQVCPRRILKFDCESQTRMAGRRPGGALERQTWGAIPSSPPPRYHRFSFRTTQGSIELNFSVQLT